MNIIYNYDPDLRKANCIVEKNNIIGMGEAKCHPDDIDICSERTGMYIAENRAMINYLQNYKITWLQPSLNSLTHLYSTMALSKQFNPNSYEAKRIRKEIKNILKEKETINCTIESIRSDIKTYINDKNRFANLYRTKRKIKENLNGN